MSDVLLPYPCDWSKLLNVFKPMLLKQKLMRNTFKKKTIGELCRTLKAECYTSMLRRAKYEKNEDLEQFAQDLAFGL